MNVRAKLMELPIVVTHPYPFEHPDEIDPLQLVHQYSAVIGSNHKVINSQDFVAYTSLNDVSAPCEVHIAIENSLCYFSLQLQYAQLLTCFECDDRYYCIVKPFHLITVLHEKVCNEIDCPLLEKENRIKVIRSRNIIRAVSIVHQCTNTCSFTATLMTKTVEREDVNSQNVQYKHDRSNNMYCLNIYKM